jgi:hypothetical protein
MPFHEAIRLALQQIRVQKLKSFFTLLGVMIGVMFLIAVVSIVTVARAVAGIGIWLNEVSAVGFCTTPAPMIVPAVPVDLTRPSYTRRHGQFTAAVVVVKALVAASATPATPPKYRPRSRVGVLVFENVPNAHTRMTWPTSRMFAGRTI